MLDEWWKFQLSLSGDVIFFTLNERTRKTEPKKLFFDYNQDDILSKETRNLNKKEMWN